MNDKEMIELLCDTAADVIGRDAIEMKPTPGLGGEDFSFFAEKVPGAFYRMGCHMEGTPIYPAHNERMVVDPACFPVGMEIMVKSALNYLAKK